MRAIIDLPDALAKDLDKILKQKDISRAEAIRRATEIWLKDNQVQEFSQAFGILKSNPISDSEITELRRELED